ncbi:rho GDP-dissociation inhibitor 3 isoform X1 [Lagenorhynchus albirostris]|uniref:rho GDP-dissociation inhibitor 3 isoform X1 n=1 Tax=Lagenorhynchus albirostris TaxID=27610 RepID=UPI0028E95DC0|nr:rho GDP-dissociation inhibitor 3 isoform X1 [Lagenorhynchus albirostris]
MLGLDACELGAQLLELLRLALCARVGGPAGQTAGSSKCQVSWQQLLTHPPRPPVLLTDKEKGQLPPDEVLDEAVPEYRAPGRKSLLEIQQLDPDDESLVNYKRALLGPEPPAVDPSLPNVQVTSLTLMSEQAPGPITMDLTGELAALKNRVFVLKEGVDYKVKITFKVNKEIVSGLKCLHHTYRQGLRVDKAVYMVGSYGPSAQEYEFVTPLEEAPRGVLVRGAYVVTSFFTDDDRTPHLSWEWGLHICQDWES